MSSVGWRRRSLVSFVLLRASLSGESLIFSRCVCSPLGTHLLQSVVLRLQGESREAGTDSIRDLWLSGNRHTKSWLTQALLFGLGVLAGSRLIWVINKSGWLVVIQQVRSPSLCVKWLRLRSVGVDFSPACPFIFPPSTVSSAQHPLDPRHRPVPTRPGHRRTPGGLCLCVVGGSQPQSVRDEKGGKRWDETLRPCLLSGRGRLAATILVLTGPLDTQHSFSTGCARTREE